jgi:hypothetical protein
MEGSKEGREGRHTHTHTHTHTHRERERERENEIKHRVFQTVLLVVLSQSQGSGVKGINAEARCGHGFATSQRASPAFSYSMHCKMDWPYQESSSLLPCHHDMSWNVLERAISVKC